MNKLIGAVVVIATVAMTVKGADVVVTVTQADGDKNLSELAVSIQPTDTLIKKGDGRLITTTELSSGGFAGNVEVQEGRLQLNAEEAIGTGRLTVGNGASVEIGPQKNVKALKSTEVFAEGFGLNGSVGAFLPVGSEQMSYMLGKSLTLTGDTLIKCNSAGFGPSSATINLNDNKLILDSGTFEARGCTFNGPGTIEVRNANVFYMENVTVANTSGDETTKLLMKSGTTLKMAGGTFAKKTFPLWTLEFEGAGTWDSYCWDDSAAACYGWRGPIVFGGDVLFKGDNRAKGTETVLSGVISGAGGIQKKGSHALSITNPDNSFEGDLNVEGGVVNVTGLNGVPSVRTGGLKGVAGFVSLDLSAETDLTDDDVYAIWRGASTNVTLESNFAVGTQDVGSKLFGLAVDLPAGYVFSKALSDAGMVIFHGGRGTASVASQMSNRPAILNYGGNLRLSGSTTQDIGWMDVRGGAVTIDAGTHVTEDMNAAFVAADYPDVARLVVNGTFTSSAEKPGLFIGRNWVDSSNYRRGIFEMGANAVVTNQINGFKALANDWGSDLLEFEGAIAAYYQHGGVFSTKGTDGFFANYVNAYYSLEGGAFEMNSAIRFARTAKNYAVFVQKGGVFRDNGKALNLGCAGGDAVYCMTAGEFLKSSGDLYVVGSEASTLGTRASFTVDGTNAVADLQNGSSPGLRLAAQANSVAMLNLNHGGKVSINSIFKVSGVSGSKAFLNFNGGVLRMPYAASTSYIFRNFAEGTDRATIYEEGATIDTVNRNWTTDFALDAPQGNGVAEIPLPAEMAALGPWEYVGAPKVTITDPSGSGFGATAIAEFDTTTGKVTGFRVMNRGMNYQSAIATISKGGYTNTFSIVCSVATNYSGGLTKDGTGTLTLNKPCSYTGRTVLAGGTLKFGCDRAIRAESRFVLAGGKLDMDGKTLSDGSSTVTSWGADVGYAMTHDITAYDNLSFPAGSTLVVDGADKLPADGVDPDLKSVVLIEVTGALTNPPEPQLAVPATKGWRVKWSGKRLRAVRESGLVLIVE